MTFEIINYSLGAVNFSATSFKIKYAIIVKKFLFFDEMVYKHVVLHVFEFWPFGGKIWAKISSPV